MADDLTENLPQTISEACKLIIAMRADELAYKRKCADLERWYKAEEEARVIAETKCKQAIGDASRDRESLVFLKGEFAALKAECDRAAGYIDRVRAAEAPPERRQKDRREPEAVSYASWSSPSPTPWWSL